MDWTAEHKSFIVETFIKNESVTATGRAFRVHFNLNVNVTLPSRNSILRWTENFRATGSALTQEMTRRVVENFRERLQKCMDNNGSHLTDVIFKK